MVYSKPTPYLNPAYASGKATTTDTTVTVTIAFDPTTTVGGIVIKANHCPIEVGVPQAECMWSGEC